MAILYIYIYVWVFFLSCLFVLNRLEDGEDLKAEILHRGTLCSNLKHGLFAAARSFNKIFFKSFHFSLILRNFSTKIPFKPAIEIENMLLRSDKTIRLYTSCLDALQNSNCIRLSIIFLYHIDILPRSIVKLPKNN